MKISITKEISSKTFTPGAFTCNSSHYHNDFKNKNLNCEISNHQAAQSSENKAYIKKTKTESKSFSSSGSTLNYKTTDRFDAELSLGPHKNTSVDPENSKLNYTELSNRFSDRELLYAITNRYKRFTDEPAHRYFIRRKRILNKVKLNIEAIAETCPDKLKWCSYEDIGIIDQRNKAPDFDHYIHIDKKTGEKTIQSKYISEISAIESKNKKK